MGTGGNRLEGLVGGGAATRWRVLPEGGGLYGWAEARARDGSVAADIVNTLNLGRI